MKQSGLLVIFSLMLVLAIIGLPSIATAHCDTMDGPTVQDGKAALEKGDITPALKWIDPKAEPELREVFEHVMKVRSSSPQASELADKYFLESLVRLHRASEGEPYTGLKPAGTEVDEGILAADKALETGSVDQLLANLTTEVQSSIKKRFQKVHELSKQKDQSVRAGREYVDAYVSYVHYVEQLADMTKSGEAPAERTDQKTEHHQ